MVHQSTAVLTEYMASDEAEDWLASLLGLTWVWGGIGSLLGLPDPQLIVHHSLSRER